MFCHALFDSANAIFPPYSQLESLGGSLEILPLSHLLREDILGTWALEMDTIHFIWRDLMVHRPNVIIECGAGVSSLILGTYAKISRPTSTEPPLVYTLEQDIDIKRLIEKRLLENSLERQVEIFYAPTTDEGKYILDMGAFREKLGDKKADWILIDGPAGPVGCRFWTLPLLSQFCLSGARWFLDDAFRDGEIEVLRSWQQFPGILVNGIHPLGKGLGTGIVSG